MFLILTICALFTSIISGLAGMGGGVLLLSIMSIFLPYGLLIPVHGIVQLVSNSSRCFYLRRHIRFDFFVPFALGAPFGLVVAYFILSKIQNTGYFYLLLACFILYALFKPKHLPEIKLRTKGWFLLGIFSAIQGSLIGATGPLIAPFYIRDDLTKEEIVSTKAFQQIVTHLLKVPLFLSLSFKYYEQLNLMISMSVMTIIGTYAGVKLLGKIKPSKFQILFKSVLFLAALRLLYKFITSVFDIL